MTVPPQQQIPSETRNEEHQLDLRADVDGIVNDANFYVQTALLWIRTKEIPVPQCNKLETHAADAAGSSLSDQPLSNRTQVDMTRPDLGLMSLHRDRLIAGIKAVGWRDPTRLSDSETADTVLYQAIQSHVETLPGIPKGTAESRKVRLTVDVIGRIHVESMMIATMNINALPSFLPPSLNVPSGSTIPRARVYLDTEATSPSIFTTHKTKHRPFYDAARKRANISASAPTIAEVLIYNPSGEVMEASLCTVYFLRDRRWITPASMCGGNMGVTRRLALENGLCEEGLIRAAELKDGESCWLSNAARGFFQGFLVLV